MTEEKDRKQCAAYRIKTVAAALRVHRGTVWAWVRKGTLEAYQLSGPTSTYRVPRSVVLAKWGPDVATECDRVEQEDTKK